ncbi:aspartic peptidase domain-containing protein [Sordaria brevicollis]|uniref:Aspartic peptidase domain-containing protein n=1 Tax=Sordaria brevicollis TaxID=83679 RepID=A0AAE0PG21_SORBR|nr:aspartic peptidase domain-containing protein [Sordaria brevicollis]
MLYPQTIASLGTLLLVAQASTTLAQPTRHAHHHKHHLRRDVAAKHPLRVLTDTPEVLWSEHGAHESSLKKRGSQDDDGKGRKEEREGSTFTIRQVKNPHFEGKGRVQRNGLSALIHAYAKYGVEPTPKIKKAMKLNPAFREYQEQLQKRGDITATVAAIPPPGNYEYVSPVEIGTPPQTVWMNIDTGSADFWVVSTDTPRYQTRGHAIYDPKSSNTSVLIPDLNWRITYADGSGAHGIVYQDLVSIDDVLSFPEQVVQSATSISWDFTTDPYVSGIMGLGMSAGNTVSESMYKDVEDRTGVKILTFMDNVREQLKEPVFTADLKDNAEGSYGFGFINETEYKGEIGYVPVMEDGIFWEFEIGGYVIGVDKEETKEVVGSMSAGEQISTTIQSSQPMTSGPAATSSVQDTQDQDESSMTIQPGSSTVSSSASPSSIPSAQAQDDDDDNTLLETTNSTAIPRRSIKAHTAGQRISYPFTTIADTGTTLLLLPDRIVADYYSTIPRAYYSNEWAGYLFPCSYTPSLPDWSFLLGSAPEAFEAASEAAPSAASSASSSATSNTASVAVSSAPSSSAAASVTDSKAEPKLDIGPEPTAQGEEPKEEQTGFYYKGTVPGRYMNYGEVNATWCYGGMQSSEDIGFSIFGDVLLKAQFVVFDLGGMRVGFAEKELTDGVAGGKVREY